MSFVSRVRGIGRASVCRTFAATSSPCSSDRPSLHNSANSRGGSASARSPRILVLVVVVEIGNFVFISNDLMIVQGSQHLDDDSHVPGLAMAPAAARDSKVPECS